MAQTVILRGNVGGCIDLRDPDDSISWARYIELGQQAAQWNKHSEAALRGWVTRRKNSKKK